MEIHLNHDDGQAFEEQKPTKGPVCGIGAFRPSFLQPLSNIRSFIVAHSTLSALSNSTYTITISQITNIEKAFGFSSSTTGLLLTLYEVGYSICSVVASYFAYRAHMPRVIGFATVVCGLAALICALPHFVAYKSDLDVHGSNASSKHVEFCVNMSAELSVSDPIDASQEASTNLGRTRRLVALVLFISGIILQGVGKAPCYPYSSQYVDDNVNKQNTGFYVGIMSSIAIFGLLLGYGLGSFISNIYITLEDIGISKKDPRFIGAWWLGFIIVGGATVLISFPMMLFPRRLKVSPEVMVSVHVRKKKRNLTNEVKELVKTIAEVLCYPVYTLTLISVCCQLLGYSTSMGFEPKYMETQFGTPSWKANVILGVVSISSYSIGTVLGGYMTKRLKMTPYFTVKLVGVFSVIVTALIVIAMFLGCPQPQIQNPHNELSVNGSEGLCDCSCVQFLPLCGSDGRTYFSPCHAGCRNGTSISFQDCRWIDGGTAESGFCPSGCVMLGPWSALKFVSGLIDAVSMMPAFIVILRSGTDKQKALALGLFAFATSMLAFLPGPVIGGKVIDSTCLIWNAASGSGAYCSLYDIEAQRFRMHGVMIGFRCAGHLLMLCALWYARKLSRWQLEEPADHHGDEEPEVQTEKMIQ